MEFEDFKNIAYEQKYPREGIIYTIYVTKVDNKYSGWWYCETCKCNSETPPSKLSDSIEKAVLDAINHTGGHHWSKHRAIK